MDDKPALVRCLRQLAAYYEGIKDWRRVADHRARLIDVETQLHQQQTANLNTLYQNRYQIERVESQLMEEYEQATRAQQQAFTARINRMCLEGSLVLCGLLFFFAYPALKASVGELKATFRQKRELVSGE